MVYAPRQKRERRGQWLEAVAAEEFTRARGIEGDAVQKAAGVAAAGVELDRERRVAQNAIALVVKHSQLRDGDGAHDIEIASNA